MKNKGKVLIYTLNKTPPIFYLAQVAPTRYRDRSHWIPEPRTRKLRVSSTFLTNDFHANFLIVDNSRPTRVFCV